jgi:hypothetical protein
VIEILAKVRWQLSPFRWWQVLPDCRKLLLDRALIRHGWGAGRSNAFQELDSYGRALGKNDRLIQANGTVVNVASQNHVIDLQENCYTDRLVILTAPADGTKFGPG